MPPYRFIILPPMYVLVTPSPISSSSTAPGQSYRSEVIQQFPFQLTLCKFLQCGYCQLRDLLMVMVFQFPHLCHAGNKLVKENTVCTENPFKYSDQPRSLWILVVFVSLLHNLIWVCPPPPPSSGYEKSYWYSGHLVVTWVDYRQKGTNGIGNTPSNMKATIDFGHK